MGGELLAAAQDAALRHAETAVQPTAGLAHRELMRRVKSLVSVTIGVPERAPAGALDAVRDLLADLAVLQTETGLFEGGDNVQSPPDTAFTINDACDVHRMLRDVTGEPAEVRDAVATLILNAKVALLNGGVHTPNHRWEVSAALARIHRSFPDPGLVERVDEWLAEGVDIDADGFYSERSPTYASAVSNPSLLAIADILGRDEPRRAVERNLELTLQLIHPDRSVESLPSRRQDQGARFPLAPYAGAFAALVAATGRADFAWAVNEALADGVDDPGLLTELLLHPGLTDALPPAQAPDRTGTRIHSTVSLAVRRGGAAETVAYGGSDYARHRRIRSGLANDPTFLRMFAGQAVLDSARLSRTFFGLGPFRAETFREVAASRIELAERVSAAYYQPLPPSLRSPRGDYAVADDGRFSAAMSFADRETAVVGLETTVVVSLRSDGADLDVRLDGPRAPWSLELAFRAGGTLNLPAREEDGAHVLTGTDATYVCGPDAILVRLDGLSPAADPEPYSPGEDYTFLSGTDAAAGERLLIGGMTPARFRVTLQAARA